MSSDANHSFLRTLNRAAGVFGVIVGAVGFSWGHGVKTGQVHMEGRVASVENRVNVLESSAGEVTELKRMLESFICDANHVPSHRCEAYLNSWVQERRN